jgi:hypothetical protein
MEELKQKVRNAIFEVRRNFRNSEMTYDQYFAELCLGGLYAIIEDMESTKQKESKNKLIDDNIALLTIPVLIAYLEKSMEGINKCKNN